MKRFSQPDPVQFIAPDRQLYTSPQTLAGRVHTPLPKTGLPLIPTPDQVKAPDAQVSDTGSLLVRDAQHYARVVSSSVAVSNAQSNLFLEQPPGLRNLLGLRNTSAAANIFIEFGRNASLNSVIRITPNGILLFDAVVPQDDLYAIADAVGGTLSYFFSNISN